jgi:DNA-binding transcriptional regulator YiaG
MNILDFAIKKEGGVCKLARSLDTTQNVVSNWRSRGRVPKGWLKALTMKYGKLMKKESAQ